MDSLIITKFQERVYANPSKLHTKCNAKHIKNRVFIISRFGTPEDLAELIQTAHNMGLMVMMDVAHNQAPSNMREGLNMFDGSSGCYFYDERRVCCKKSSERNFDFTK